MILLVCSIVYYLTGLVLFASFRNSIVIRKRIPLLIIFIQSMILVVLLVVLLYLESEMGDSIFSVPCVIRDSIISFCLTFALCLSVMQKLFLGKHLLWNWCQKLFCKKGNVNFCFVRSISNALLLSSCSFLYTIIYYLQWASQSQSLPTELEGCESSFMRETAFVEIVHIIYNAIFVFLVVRIVKIGSLDKIGIGLEIILYQCLILLFLCIFPFLGISDSKYWFILTECLIFIFFAYYYPLVILYDYKVTISSKTMATLEDPRLFELCKRFYCEELYFFLLRFTEFQNGNLTAEEIIKQFIEKGAPCELNLTEDTRNKVLQSSDSTSTTNSLSIVNIEVRQMLKDGLLPYLQSSNNIANANTLNP